MWLACDASSWHHSNVAQFVIARVAEAAAGLPQGIVLGALIVPLGIAAAISPWQTILLTARARAKSTSYYTQHRKRKTSTMKGRPLKRLRLGGAVTWWRFNRVLGLPDTTGYLQIPPDISTYLRIKVATFPKKELQSPHQHNKGDNKYWHLPRLYPDYR